MTDSNVTGGPSVDDYADFESDFALLCEDVANGLDPTAARQILGELIKKHNIPELLAKSAAAVLDKEIVKVNLARRNKQGPNPDPMLDSSLQSEFEKRVRIRFGIGSKK